MHGPNGQNVPIWQVTRCFCGYWWNFLRKCQNCQFFDGKCTNLVTLVETEFQCYQITGLPDMNIFGQILAIFGFFSKIFGEIIFMSTKNEVGIHETFFYIILQYKVLNWILSIRTTQIYFQYHYFHLEFASQMKMDVLIFLLCIF